MKLDRHAHDAAGQRLAPARQAGVAGGDLACDLGVAAEFLDRWAEAEHGRHLLLSILPDTVHPRGETFDWPRDKADALRWIDECGIRCRLAAGRFAAAAPALAGRIEAAAAWRTVRSGLRARVERILRDEPELPWAEAVARVAARARP